MKFSLLESYRKEIIASAEEYNRELANNFRSFQEEISEISVKSHYDKLHNALMHFVDVYNEQLRKDIMTQLILRWLDSGAAFHDFSDAFMMGDTARNAAYSLESRVSDAWLTNERLNLFEGLAFEADAATADRADFEQAKDCFTRHKQILEETTEHYLGHYSEYRREENEFFLALMPVVAGFGAAAAAFMDAGHAWVDQLEEEYLEKMARARAKTEDVYKHAGSAVAGDVGSDNFNASPAVAGGAVAAGVTAAGAAVGGAAVAASNSENKYQEIIQALQNFKGRSCVHSNRIKECENKRKEIKQQLQQKVADKEKVLLRELDYYRNSLMQQLREEYKKIDGVFNFLQSREEKNQEKYRLYQEAEQLCRQKYAECESEFNNYVKYSRALYHSQKQFLLDTFENSDKQYKSCYEIGQNKKRYITNLQTNTDVESTLNEIRGRLTQANKSCVDKCPMFVQLCAALNVPCGQVKNSSLQISQFADQSLQKASKLKNEELLYYPIRTDKMTWEENLKAINPRHQESKDQGNPKYTHNCQRCVITYEARSRGYDVTAGPRKKIEKRDAQGNIMKDKNGKTQWVSIEELANRESPIGYPKAFNGGTIEYLGGATVEEAVENIKKRMQQYGDGARAFVAITRVRRSSGAYESGHVFIAEQRNGKTIFCDPQTGRTNAISNFNCRPITATSCQNYCKNCVKFKVENNEITMTEGKLNTSCPFCVFGTKIRGGTVDCQIIQISRIGLMRMDNLEFTDLVHQCFEQQKGATK